MEVYEIVYKAINLSIGDEINLSDNVRFVGTGEYEKRIFEKNSFLLEQYEKRKKYCTMCNNIETFKWETNTNNSFLFNNADVSPVILKNNEEYVNEFKENFYFIEKCTHCNTAHISYFNYNKDNYILTKVGEFPTIEKTIYINKEYHKYLPNKNSTCLSKALILRQTGYTKGAIAYLRTCFEYIIDNLLPSEDDKKKYMSQKIKLVKYKLPEEFRTSSTYKILSTDIHEYNEIDTQEMMLKFDIVYKVIEHVLDGLVNEEKKLREKKELMSKMNEFCSKH